MRSVPPRFTSAEPDFDAFEGAAEPANAAATSSPAPITARVSASKKRLCIGLLPCDETVGLRPRSDLYASVDVSLHEWLVQVNRRIPAAAAGGAGYPGRSSRSSRVRSV